MWTTVCVAQTPSGISVLERGYDQENEEWNEEEGHHRFYNPNAAPYPYRDATRLCVLSAYD